MSYSNIVESVKRDKIRESIFEKIFPLVNPLLKTELGHAIIKEDLDRFILVYEKILGGGYLDIKVEDFAELKYLQNRILVLSKRISEYLKIEQE